MKRFIIFLLFAFVATTSFAQFSDTAQLNAFIKDTIKDRRPDKVTAADIQKGMLGISKFLLSAPNFATTNLKFTGSRTHNLRGNDLFFDSTRTFIVRTPTVSNGLFQIWDYPAAFTKIVNIGDVGSDTYLNVDNFNSTIQIVSPNIQVNGQSVVTQDKLDDTASALRVAMASSGQNIYTNDGTITGYNRHVNLAHAQLVFEGVRPAPVDWESPNDTLYSYVGLNDTTDDDNNFKIINKYTSGGVRQDSSYTVFSSYGMQHTIYINDDNYFHFFTASNQSAMEIHTKADWMDTAYYASNYIAYSGAEQRIQSGAKSVSISQNLGQWVLNEGVIQLWATKNQWTNSGAFLQVWSDSIVIKQAPLVIDNGYKVKYSFTGYDSTNFTDVLFNGVWGYSTEHVKGWGLTGYDVNGDDYGQFMAFRDYDNDGTFYGQTQIRHTAGDFRVLCQENESTALGHYYMYRFGTSGFVATEMNNNHQSGTMSMGNGVIGLGVQNTTGFGSTNLHIENNKIGFEYWNNAGGFSAMGFDVSGNGYTQVVNGKTVYFKNSSLTNFATFDASTGDATLTGKVTGTSFVTTSTAAPTSTADATGVNGEIRVVGGYLYFKQPSTGWVRVALSTF